MTKYFAAFPLPADVAEHVAARLPSLPAGARVADPAGWHLTVAFYGPDPSPFAEIRATPVAPRLRLASSGTFPGVSWVGVDVDNTGGPLRDLVALAGGRPDRFVPHLTIARWPDRKVVDLGMADYAGPWWTPPELVLYRTDPGSVYTPVDQVTLLHAE